MSLQSGTNFVADVEGEQKRKGQLFAVPSSLDYLITTLHDFSQIKGNGSRRDDTFKPSG